MNNGDEQLRCRVYDHDHPNPGPLPHQTYAALVGGPLDGLLLDIACWRPEESAPARPRADAAFWSHRPTSIPCTVTPGRRTRAHSLPRVSSSLPTLILLGATGGLLRGALDLYTRLVHRSVVLMEESVLRFRTADPEAMRGQLRHLLAVMPLADVVLREAEGQLATMIEGTVRCAQNRARLVRALYARLDRLETATGPSAAPSADQGVSPSHTHGPPGRLKVGPDRRCHVG
ncbi:hypothetical protein EES39_39615 [Streptomyces sp. ADI92-24]|uniref:Scr1 family TA system antitoxin-like transcriptional regulator n=1 Tax=Streptomyces sp. ADI92-24 TaxID=1522756 RepID=UPI000F9226D9|nr:Scr1 family TA system antitoxin-like transcriptional regulator [Streptomyces sp. ADI92-24]RPK32038.1 hypothetical protein EES39_39615 [Streptomyces sp. ADI92-24]